jgi:hypothetical protein
MSALTVVQRATSIGLSSGLSCWISRTQPCASTGVCMVSRPLTYAERSKY